MSFKVKVKTAPKLAEPAAPSGEVVQPPAHTVASYQASDFGRCEKCLQSLNSSLLGSQAGGPVHDCLEVELVKPFQLNGVIYPEGKRFVPADAFHTWKSCVKE